MSNSIAYAKNYTSTLNAVYECANVSGCLTSGRRIVRSGRNAKEVMIPKTETSGLGDYTGNVGYKIVSNNYAFETNTLNNDRGIRMMPILFYLSSAYCRQSRIVGK